MEQAGFRESLPTQLSHQRHGPISISQVSDDNIEPSMTPNAKSGQQILDDRPKLEGPVANTYHIGSMHPSDGPQNLIAAILIPHQQPAYKIDTATVPPSYSSAQWWLNNENGNFSFRTMFTAPGFENLVMTRSNGDVDGGAVLGGKFINHPTQLWMFIQWRPAHYTFFAPGTDLALQPQQLGVVGSPLILRKMVNNTPGPGQLWLAEH